MSGPTKPRLEKLPDPRGAILPLLPHLRGYARGFTGGDDHAADDLVQDVVMLALQAWDSFVPGTNLKAWLYRILHNRHLTIRSRKHHEAEVGVDDLARHGSVPAFQEDLADLRHFKAAFARLKPSHREVLVLYAVHGMSLEEIAAVVGCKAQAIKSRMNRARTTLKTMLGDRPAKGQVVTRPPAGPVPVAPFVAVPALVPPQPEPILVRPAPNLPVRYLAQLALAEQHDAEASPEVIRRSFALVLAYRAMILDELADS
jgi:RNA polymerase sigma-70 factor, ECF subfamily